MLRSLPVELLTQLEITVLVFQEPDVYQILCARSTSDLHFRNQCSRHDWVWVQVDFVTGRTGPGKRGPQALFPVPPHSTACSGVPFSAFPAHVSAQAPVPQIAQRGPR